MANTKEYLVLSELSYFKVNSNEKGEKINDLEYESKFKDETGKDITVTGLTYGQFNTAFGNDITNMSDWKVIAYENNNAIGGSGFCGTAFQNAEGEIVFAFRGTEPNLKNSESEFPLDVFNDVQIALRNGVLGMPEQFGTNGVRLSILT